MRTDEDEQFDDLDSEFSLEVDDEVDLATRGTFAFVARGADHTTHVLNLAQARRVPRSRRAASRLLLGKGKRAIERVRLMELCDRTGIALA